MLSNVLSDEVRNLTWDPNTGVTRVFYGSDFVTVTKSEDTSWDLLKPEIFAAIMDFYSSGQPLFLDEKTASAMDTAIQEVCHQISLCELYEFWGLHVNGAIRSMFYLCFEDIFIFL